MQTQTEKTLALRPREAAQALSISPRCLFRFTKAGLIPCLRIGEGKRKTVLYPRAALESWLKIRTAPKAIA